MKYLIICLLLLTIKGSAQDLKDFIPEKGFEFVEQAEGDLDKDGVSEIVYAYNTTHKTVDFGYDRVLYICKKINGKVKLWKKNTTVLWKSEDYGFKYDEGMAFEMSVKNNTLIIKQTFNGNSRHRSSYKSIYRYQNGDWYLIGATTNDYDTCEYDFQYDINFSIKKVNVAETYGDCDEGKKIPEDRIYSFSYPFKLQKMDGFYPRKTAVEIPKYKFTLVY
ncbi:hypothetical protein [Pedobacter metabolipauper]|uniref:Uncharacterized protein n=1 Tax=Pedobacter metabolipauper TaxID=425513 RepID=A0A4R6SXZ9_9SPHI|nr:hypothetical protein [Pedobacter metabolipauper]TDQ11414.1 hypothetical protein ATK78_0536 [Pedobacter metabolipauper]